MNLLMKKVQYAKFSIKKNDFSTSSLSIVSAPKTSLNIVCLLLQKKKTVLLHQANQNLS